MICLTFDTDWCPELLVEHTLNLAKPVDGQLTFFCTGVYATLKREAERVELALHPNFHQGGEDPDDTLTKLSSQLPEAVGLRGHSCADSHRILALLRKHRLRYTSNTAPLFAEGLRPHEHPWGGHELPIYYMDNLDFLRLDHWDGAVAFAPEVIECAVKQPGLFVFDFHPVHLTLNTPSQGYYEANKHRYQDAPALLERTHAGRGTRTFFIELVDAMRRAAIPSVSMSEALDTLAPRRRYR